MAHKFAKKKEYSNKKFKKINPIKKWKIHRKIVKWNKNMIFVLSTSPHGESHLSFYYNYNIY